MKGKESGQCSLYEEAAAGDDDPSWEEKKEERIHSCLASIRSLCIQTDEKIPTLQGDQ